MNKAVGENREETHRRASKETLRVYINGLGYVTDHSHLLFKSKDKLITRRSTVEIPMTLSYFISVFAAIITSYQVAAGCTSNGQCAAVCPPGNFVSCGPARCVGGACKAAPCVGPDEGCPVSSQFLKLEPTNLASFLFSVSANWWTYDKGV